MLIIWIMAGVAAVMLALILYSVLVVASRTDDAIERHFEKRPVKHREPTPHSQTAKADAGKPCLSLVPMQILYDIAEVRAYGCRKYPEGGPDNWKGVEPERYRDAAFRHLLAYIRDPEGTDEESGLPHLWHLACNIAFLCELEKDKYELHKPMPHSRRHRSRAISIRRMLGSCHRKIRGWLRALSNLMVRRKL